MNLQEIIINSMLAIKLDSIIEYNRYDPRLLRMKPAFRYICGIFDTDVFFKIIYRSRALKSRGS